MTSSEKKPIHYLMTFHSGMIGDFLMLLNLAENAQAADPSVVTKIFLSRNLSLFKELIGEHYPYVRLIPIADYAEVMKSVFSRNAFIILKFYRGDSLKTIFFGWLLTRMPGSRFISFKESHYSLKKILGSETVPFDSARGYFENLLSETDLLGWKQSVTVPVFRYSPDSSVLSVHGLKKPYVILHITPSRKWRTLPFERWEKIVAQVQECIPHSGVILTGSPEDRPFVDGLARHFTDGSVINYSGTFSPAELISAIHFSELYIGVDTGITHLASMMGKKSLVIGHGATLASLPSYAPNTTVMWNEASCRCTSGDCFIYENGDRYLRCMLSITDGEIRAALEKLLQK